MPLFLFIVGLIFLVATVRGPEKTKQLMALIRSDFTGPGNFLIWAIVLGGIAGLGYSSKLKPFSNGFLGLVFIVLLLSKGRDGKDFLSSFIEQIRSTERA